MFGLAAKELHAIQGFIAAWLDLMLLALGICPAKLATFRVLERVHTWTLLLVRNLRVLC